MTTLAVPKDRLLTAGNLLTVVAAIAIASITAVALGLLAPHNFEFFRASWLLHPFEQEHLTIARNLAHGHGLTISDSTLDPAYGSEDKGYTDGRFVPRSVLVPYLIYAAAFLISDAAWLKVTPLFAIIAASACFAIVFRRNGSIVASIGAFAAFYLAAPVLLASSGIAYESLIALAFVLWGAFFAESLRTRPSVGSGALAGLMFALAANSRPDYAPAGFLFLALLSWWLLHVRLRLKANIYSRMLVGAIAAALMVFTGAGCVLLTNFAFTGNPLQSAYGPSAWFASPGGVSHGLLTFRPSDFILQARLFLWDIAKPTLPLLGLACATIVWRRRLRWADFILLSFSAFLVVFHLERTGSHGSTTATLVSSPARYVMPVYATAAIAGFSALDVWLKAVFDGNLLRPVIAASLAVLVAAAGVNEAFTNRTNLPLVGLSLDQHRLAHEFSLRHQDALFVGDVYTKGIIVTVRTLIPRLTDSQRVTSLVDTELRRGRAVYVTDNWPDVASGPYYSGYVERLAVAGLVLCPERGKPFKIQRVLDPSAIPDGSSAIDVAARDAAGVVVATDPGRTYYVLSQGSFINDPDGNVSDARYFWIDGKPPKLVTTTGGIACATYRATGQNIRIGVADSAYGDNSGSLHVSIIPAN